MCKIFVTKWYHAIVTNKNEENKDSNGYQTSVEPSMIPERKLLYEMIRLLQTDTYISGRKMSHTIHSIMKDLTTKIEMKKLENAMNVVPHTPAADGLLSIIEDVNRMSINPVPEENDDDEQIAVSTYETIPIDEDELMMEECNKNVDRTDWRKKNVKVGTKKTHKYLSAKI